MLSWEWHTIPVHFDYFIIRWYIDYDTRAGSQGYRLQKGQMGYEVLRQA
jgi:hypothetical protein